MKRVIVITFLLGLILILATPLVWADEEPLIITPSNTNDGPIYYAAVGQEIFIRAGWGACTRGLVEASRHTSSIALKILSEGVPLVTVEPPSREYWNKPVTYEPDPNGINACVMTPSKEAWRTEWFYSLGTLEPGEYEGHFLWTFPHPLPDGGDYDGDGHIDIFVSDSRGNSDRFSFFTSERTFTIIVE